MSTWTKTYCGVTHLKPLKPGFQITVTLWTDWAEAYVLEGLRTVSKKFFDGADFEAAARAWGEEQATGLGLVFK